METQKNKIITKQQETDTIVASFNKAQEQLRREIMFDIEQSSLDADEQGALKQRLFPNESLLITSPAIIGLGKIKHATNEILRDIMGGKSFISHNIIVDTFNKDRDQLVKCEGFKDENVTNYSIGFLEEAAATGMFIAVYQPLSKTAGTIGLDDFAEICKGMAPKSGGKLLYTDQFDVKNGKVNERAWFAEDKYSEFRKNTIIVPNVIRLATTTEIPGTANQKFMAQVEIVCDWIEKSFPRSITETMKNAIAEIRKDFKMLENLQNNDSAGFVNKIVTYKFFTLFMETGLETLWRMIAYEQVTGIKLLQGMYLRNNVVEPVNADLGYSGFWDSDGPFVSWYYAGHSRSDGGLGFSCTGI